MLVIIFLVLLFIPFIIYAIKESEKEREKDPVSYSFNCLMRLLISYIFRS